MEKESRAFIDEVLNKSTGTVSELLTADWTIADAPLAALYGVPGASSGQHTSLTGTKRRGILNQGAFLSVFATNNGSHPVFRGVAIMRRVACVNLSRSGRSASWSRPFLPISTKTTRDRFQAHSLDATVPLPHEHRHIGFAFENFDGIGKRERGEGLPVNTKVT